MQPVVSVSPAISSAGKFPFNPASNFAPILINRKRPDILHDTASYARVYQTWTGFLAPRTLL